MKIRNPACVLTACALALALIGQGCSKSADTAPTPPGEPAAAIPIVPNLSVGKIRAGMTVQELIAAIGEPQRKTARTYDYPRLGLAAIPTVDGIVQVVMCGDVTGINGAYVKAFTGRTKEGIGMRSTREEILKAYGPPTETRGKEGGLESMKYEPLGITFNLEGGKVHHMIVVLRGEEPPQQESIKLNVVPASSQSQANPR